MIRDLEEGESYYQVPASIVVIAANADDARRVVGDLLRPSPHFADDDIADVTIGTPMGVQRAARRLAADQTVSHDTSSRG